jgi:hypothetical protein
MFETIEAWFKGVKTKSGKSLIEEIEGLVTNMEAVMKRADVIEADLQVAKNFVTTYGALIPGLGDKILAVEAGITMIQDDVKFIKKVMPDPTPSPTPTT